MGSQLPTSPTATNSRFSIDYLNSVATPKRSIQQGSVHSLLKHSAEGAVKKQNEDSPISLLINPPFFSCTEKAMSMSNCHLQPNGGQEISQDEVSQIPPGPPAGTPVRRSTPQRQGVGTEGSEPWRGIYIVNTGAMAGNIHSECRQLNLCLSEPLD